MDGNKDAAAKCLRIGKEALESGDRPRALRFLSKARRLDPSLPVHDLLSKASADDDGEVPNPHPSPGDSSAPSDKPAATPSSSSSPSSTATAASRAKAKAAAAASASASDAASRSYTDEQVEIVRQIRKQKDYYQILGLERECTEEDVRKAYRKISLKVHPDKNQAPGAEEAFKAVSRAFQFLNDKESRKRYDVVGSDEPVNARAPARHGRHSHGFNGFYEEEFDADEIFRNFFFGGMAPATTTPFGTFRYRTGGMGAHHGTQGPSNSNLRMLVQILPVIILLLLNFLPSSDPIYTLSSSYAYEHKLQTARGVPYYVKSAKFEEEYPRQSSKRFDLERRVERDYVGTLSQNCRVELQRRQWGISYETPHCDMLRKFEAAS